MNEHDLEYNENDEFIKKTRECNTELKQVQEQTKTKTNFACVIVVFTICIIVTIPFLNDFFVDYKDYMDYRQKQTRFFHFIKQRDKYCHFEKTKSIRYEYCSPLTKCDFKTTDVQNCIYPYDKNNSFNVYVERIGPFKQMNGKYDWTRVGRSDVFQLRKTVETYQVLGGMFAPVYSN